MATKLTRAVTSALKDKRVDYPEAAKVTAAATWDAPNQRLTPADAAALKRLAAKPDSTFVDRKAPSYVRAQRDEIREYAETIKALQKVRLEVTAEVPGITVGLKKDLAVVDRDELGYQHELILEVQMPGERAEADGTLTFRYGDFEVSLDVKKGQTRESIMSRIGARLGRQQDELKTGESTKTSREFFLHPFAAQEDAAQETVVWGSR